MLNCGIIGQLPDSIRLSRNNRPIEAQRTQIGSLAIADRQIWIADAEMVDNVPSLPVRPHNGTYPVYTYQWHYREGIINVCIAIVFCRRPKLRSQQLVIRTEIRPDLTEGVIVDFGEVAVKASNAMRVAAGLGDGYYPVCANYDPQNCLQSLVVDFKIWELCEYVLLPGQMLDEYGMVTFSDGPTTDT